VRLRDGSEVEDPRLDRLVQFDERSRGFGITLLLEAQDKSEPRSYTWGCDVRTLDQGREGACVGFAWMGEAAARPVVRKGVTNQLALDVYRRAQQIDEWPGVGYSGTSVLAGAKAMQERGWLREYRWAFGAAELAAAVSRHGPAVLGIPWHESMYQPVNGWITRSGRVVGGHAILCVGYNVKRQAFTLQNSWGSDWGQQARALISYADLSSLLDDNGEACLPVLR
jgi:hypothetical protein